MKRILQIAALFLLTLPVMAQETAIRVQGVTKILVKPDSTNFYNHARLTSYAIMDSTGTPSAPPAGKVYVYSRGVLGVWARFSDGDTLRLDSTGTGGGGATDTTSLSNRINLKAPLASPDFTGDISLNGDIEIHNAGGGRISFHSASGLANVFIGDSLYVTNGVNTGLLKFPMTGDHIWSMRDANGTIALAENQTFTGATAVDSLLVGGQMKLQPNNTNAIAFPTAGNDGSTIPGTGQLSERAGAMALESAADLYSAIDNDNGNADVGNDAFRWTRNVGGVLAPADSAIMTLTDVAHLGVGKGNTSPMSPLSVYTPGYGNDTLGFNLTNRSYNFTVNTAAQARDTSVINFRFTGTGKPLVDIVGPLGGQNIRWTLDSAGQINMRGAPFQIIASDSSASSSVKTMRIGSPNYRNTDEFSVLVSSSGATAAGNVVNVGGGTALGRAANLVRFYTGADTSVTTGTERARFTNTGKFAVNKTSAVDQVDIEGALRSDTIKSDSIYYTSDPVLKYPIAFLDIRHYPVVGDGVTDDSAAIHSAIVDALAKNLPLVFRPLLNGNKTFLTGGHAVNSRVHLIWQDGAVWLQKGGLSTAADHALLKFNTGSNGSIVENAVLDGNRLAIKGPLITAATNVHWSGIWVNVPDVTIINPEIRNTAGAAIYSISALVSKPRLTITNAYIHSCGTGMILYGMDDLRISGAMLDSIFNDSVGIYQHALDIFGGKGFKIDGLTIRRIGSDDYGLSLDGSGITIKSATGEINNLLMSEKITSEKILCLSLFSSYIRGTNWRLEKIGGTGIELGSMLGFDLTNFEADGGYIIDNTGWPNRGITNSWYGHDYLTNGTTTSSVGYNRNVNITNGYIAGYDYGITEAAGNATYTNLNITGNTKHGIEIRDWAGNQSFATISNDTVYRNIKLVNITSTFNGWAGLQIKKADNLQVIGGNYSNNGQDATFTAAYRAGIMDTSGGSIQTVALTGISAYDNQTTTSTAMASMDYSAYGATYSTNDTIGFIFTKPWTYYPNQRATVGGIPIKILHVKLDSIRAVATGSGSYPTSTTSGTGTISSSGTTVTGSGTAFTGEITGRYWIKAGSQYRRVYLVTDDTHLKIEYAFSPDLGGGTSYSLVRLDVVPTQSQQSGFYMTNAPLVDVANLVAYGNVTTQQNITNGRFGINIRPQFPFHLGDGVSVNSGLGSTDKMVASYNNVAPGFTGIVSSNTATHRFVFKGVRSRGTVDVPTKLSDGDDVLSFLGTIWDSSAARATAEILFESDGGSSPSVAPQRISFWTGATTSRSERMRLNSAGNLTLGSTTLTSLFNVGSAAQFQVNTTGNIVKLNNVTTSFPSSQGAASTVLTNSDGADSTWAAPVASLPSPSVSYEETEEWIYTNGAGKMGWTVGSTGTGSIAATQEVSIATADSNHVGIIDMTAGTVNTGYSVVHLGQVSVKFSGGEKIFEADIKTPSAVTAAADYYMRIGFHDAITQAVVTDGVYFEWHADSASQGWRGTAANNSNGTTNKSYTSASSAISASTWYRLRCVVNATGTSATFYINDVQLGSAITTNIPTASGRQCGPNILIGSYGTSAAKTMAVDYYYMKYSFSPVR